MNENIDNSLLFSEAERIAREEVARMSPEESDDVWRSFMELLVEAMEECLRDGTWIPGRGLICKGVELNDAQKNGKKGQ